MKAVILLGGQGTRLRPFTLRTPKALLPVANRPLLAHQLSWLKRYGVKEVVLAVGYRGDDVRRLSGVGRETGVAVRFSEERTPLGTGGALANAAGLLRGTEPFLVLNGDVLADMDLGALSAVHRERRADLTIGVAKVPDPGAYGLVICGREMRIERFVEKPAPDEITADTINAGVYMFNPGVLKEIPKGSSMLEHDLFPRMVSGGRTLWGYVHYGYWMDVGTTAKLMKANRDAVEGKTGALAARAAGGPAAPRASLGAGTVIEAGAEIRGWAAIGSGCWIGPGAVVENSVIFDKTSVGAGSRVADCLIGAECTIGASCALAAAVIADGSLLRDYTTAGNAG